MKFELKDIIGIVTALVVFAVGYGAITERVKALETANDERKNQAIDLALLKQEMQTINRQLGDIKDILRKPIGERGGSDEQPRRFIP